MQSQTSVTLKAPYLLFIGDISDMVYAKTAAGIIQWNAESVAGILRFEGNALDLGVQDMSIDEAIRAGVQSLVIGVAPMGGSVSSGWLEVLIEAARKGLDIVSGLHVNLQTFGELVSAADSSGAKLINVRTPPTSLPVGKGTKRTGNRLLTVGTDCAVGKKYTALAITQALKDCSIPATFRATGQTGIMISGRGIPIDAVVADFISGAAELVSPENSADHWDVIEGQGSLFHPAYAGVSLGLLHGSQPDALVICHDATRTTVAGCPEFSVPSLQECITANIRCARLTNPNAKVVGVSVNTSKLAPEERSKYLADLSKSLELPCVDPIIDGCHSIVPNLLNLNK